MAENTVAGGCSCGAVTFEVTLPFAAFRYCHCSRCRKASGSAHAANAFVAEKQFRRVSGESLVKQYDLTGAKRFSVWCCSNCGTRVPHKAKITENMLIPAGLLDGDPGMRPENSIFWKSKANWYVEAREMPRLDEYS